MKECDNCAYGGWLNGKDAITEICIKCRHNCGEPTKWKAMPMTNAERIRAMSDEELARHLHCIGWDCHLCAEHKMLDNEPLLRLEKCDENCFEHCLEWLKQPAEDNP